MASTETKSYIRTISSRFQRIGLRFVSYDDAWAEGDGVSPQYYHDVALEDARKAKKTDRLKMSYPANGKKLLEVNLGPITAMAEIKDDKVVISQGTHKQVLQMANRDVFRYAARMVLDYVQDQTRDLTR